MMMRVAACLRSSTSNEDDGMRYSLIIAEEVGSTFLGGLDVPNTFEEIEERGCPLTVAIHLASAVSYGLFPCQVLH